MKLEHDGHVRWRTDFVNEQERLLTVLAHVTDGGVIERLQHIGSTSIPGMPAMAALDIGLAVSPFPLPSPQLESLDTLNYTLISNGADQSFQRFRHRTQPYQLWVTEAGSDSWLDWLLVRDFLRAELDVCRHTAALRQTWAHTPDYASKKAAHFAELSTSAQQWWINYNGFDRLRSVVDELTDYAHPWWIGSGWALDLFLGRVTRVHHDVDVVLPYRHQLDLQSYLLDRGWRFVTPLDGRLEPWPRHMRLELPRHQAQAHSEEGFIDFLLTDIDHGVWRYRREPSIVQSVERMGLHSPDGIPFLAPELVLLFKSRNTSGKARPKDQADFENILPHLDQERRAWLRWVLTTQNSNHAWLPQLG